MTLKKQYMRYGLILLAVYVALVLAGSFWDYPISDFLYPGTQSTWGQIFAAFGELPAFLCICASGGILIVRRKNINPKWDLLICTLGACMIVFAVLMQTHSSCDAVPQLPRWAAYFVNIFLLAVGSVLILAASRTASTKTVMRFVMTVFCASCAVLILSAIIKLGWGRVRMRYIVSTGTEEYYSAWWQMGSEIKNALVSAGADRAEFDSFPSKSCANAALGLLAVLIPTLQKKLAGKEKYFLIGGGAWLLLVGISRICMGAHFLSDVAFGAMISLLVCAACVWLFYFKSDLYNYVWNYITTADNPFVEQ